jgi:hypothetical protein
MELSQLVSCIFGVTGTIVELSCSQVGHLFSATSWNEVSVSGLVQTQMMHICGWEGWFGPVISVTATTVDRQKLKEIGWRINCSC